MNYKLEAGIGREFTSVSKQAKEIATEENVIVEFEFNECICLVNNSTDLNFLYRDYSNHWTMGWKEIGPDCVAEYSEEVRIELERKNKLSEQKAEAQRIEQKKKKMPKEWLLNQKRTVLK